MQLLLCVFLAGLAVAAANPLAPFLGKFESTGKHENTAAFAAAAEMEDVQSVLFNEFVAVGDEFHHKFGIKDGEYKQDLAFKLGEERQAAHKGKDFKYKYVVEGQVLKADFKILPNGRHVVQTYTITPEGFLKTYKINDVEAKVWFNKV